MFNAVTFLLRWLYLSNLVRDVAEIQMLPYTPHQQQPPPPPMDVPNPNTWKDDYLRGIMSYPPGTQRLYAIDCLRYELVQQLSSQLGASDAVVQRYAQSCKRLEYDRERRRARDYGNPADSEDDDPYLDADVEIVRALKVGAEIEKDETPSGEESEEEAVLVISNNGADVVDSQRKVDESMPTEEELEQAQCVLGTFRDSLPQLAAAALKSPGALQPQLLDPIQKLKRLLLTRCVQDANWGIELCWLLEAEVGRAWKTLFEHRQQTGKRLIVVLPAEKAAVIAKIGSAKSLAFDLLQGVEQATAYGYTIPNQLTSSEQSADMNLSPMPARLPSSLSLRRCSHFGDTMHFIDRLTKISLDMRSIPNLQRHVRKLFCLLPLLPFQFSLTWTY